MHVDMIDVMNKKKKGSRRRKKDWRKLDSTTYTEWLKSRNSQLFTGGLVSEKSDHELFFTNKKKKKVVVKDKLHPLKRPLRCLAALENKSLVNIACNNKETKMPKSNKKKSTIVSKTDITELNRILPERKPKPNMGKIFDIWSSQGHNDKTRVHEKPDLLKQNLPHPGFSYNPEPELHQDLLWAAHVAIKNDEDEKDLAQKIYNEGFNIPKELLEKREEEMMLSGLGEDEKVPKETEMVVEDVIRKSFRREKKTRSQINAKKRNLMKERMRLRECLNSKRDKQFRNLNDICKKLDDEDKRIGENKELTSKRRAALKSRTKRLARLKFREPLPLDVKPSDELPSSLTKLAPEGSLLKEHYVGFQKRNLICPSRKLSRKKTKYREVVRRSLRYL